MRKAARQEYNGPLAIWKGERGMLDKLANMVAEQDSRS